MVLGAILLEKDAMERASEIIRPESFYVDAHREVYTAAYKLHAAGKAVDSMTVMNELANQNKLEEIGGAWFLVELTKDVVSSAHIEDHCRIIQQKFIRRELIRISGQIIENAYNETSDEFDALEWAEKAVLEIGQQNTSGGYVGIETALMKAVEKIEKNRASDSVITGVPCGLLEVDKVTLGWQPETLVILAARPAVGKSALAMNFVRNAARSIPVAVWSLEMSYEELTIRMVSAESEIDLYRLHTGRLEESDMKKIYDKAVVPLLECPIFFDDSPSVSIAGFRSKARRLKKKHDIGLIVVDYLQLMNGERTKNSNREQEISTISRSLKNLAKELKIPIIALSQLSREVEKRSGQEPKLSDLRESGAIEQDADMVIFLWGPTDNEIEQDSELDYQRFIKIAKHRNGGLLHKEELRFEKNIQLFRNPGASPF